MDKFEYLATLVSVVAGLALTRALSGLAYIIHKRQVVKLSGVHFAWTGSVLLWLVSYWWFTFYLSSIEQWTIPLFLFVLIYGAFIYFLIALLYPGKYGAEKDLFYYFIENRQWFFGTFVALGCLDVADTVIKATYGIPTPPLIIYSALMVSWLTLGTIGALTTNRMYHKIFAYGWFIVFGMWSVLIFAA